jgi:hypothetical protein
MSSKKAFPSIEVEDASQLSMLAYQVQTRPKTFDVKPFLDRLKTEHARRIGRVIVGDEDAAGDEAIQQAGYFLRWAEETAKTAREASRRPGGRHRFD